MRRFKNVDRSTLDVDQLHGFIVSQTIKLSEKLGRKKRKTTEKPLGFINPQDWKRNFSHFAMKVMAHLQILYLYLLKMVIFHSYVHLPKRRMENQLVIVAPQKRWDDKLQNCFL